MSRSSYITPEGEQRLRGELTALWTEERPKVTRAVADAAAEGDRSENAEYIYGKKRLREIDRRIRFLSKRLDELEVVVPEGRRRDDRVYFGAWVRVENAEAEHEDDEVAEYRIVGPDETHVHAGGISIDSPVGRALMGKAVGDEALVRRPKGELLLTILDIRYSANPESDDDNLGGATDT